MTTEEISFTAEEEAQFTLFNTGAMINMREDARAKDKIPPCWLSASEETREEYRLAFLKMVEKAGRKMTVDEVERVLVGTIMETQRDMWKNHELELKQERAKGNPRAFFLE